MAEVLSPYSSTLFNQVNDIMPQRNDFHNRSGECFVFDVLQPLIVKHKVEDVFGVGVVHRHFDLPDDAMLIEHGNFTGPWYGWT